MGARTEWQATLRPRMWMMFVPPVVVGGLAQLALMSSTSLGAAVRGNPVFVIVPLYASIFFAITNALIARRITYTLEGNRLIVARWWTRRSFSLVNARIACGKCTSALQGVVGTLLQVTTPDGTLELVGAGHLFKDAGSYTLPSRAAHVPSMNRDDFASLLAQLAQLAQLASPSAARATAADKISIEITTSGAFRVMWWSFGSMLAAMVATIGGIFGERFARAQALSPDAELACQLAATLAAFIGAGSLLVRFGGTPRRLEFTSTVVTLWRGTRAVVRDVPIEQLVITHGSHIVGRGGGKNATLVVRFPAGPTLRIIGNGVAPADPSGRGATVLVQPKLAVASLEWPTMLRCLRRAQVRS